ncbi:uncharacterized protein LOC129778554 [Toxorhynchites rutilus septentrionalis]|uniref:uncharacterized protein LOC129778554 n=1 Tax=Toxorhynchites rutilus septentrionalis TaxID=329112 RepID=UPI002479ED4C|nr:uncharacterized protein LOC129778554 [Toxorhynchites rutilus septentrionalis]
MPASQLIIFIAFIIVTQIHRGQFLRCTFCDSTLSFESCDSGGELLECSDRLVRIEHEFLLSLNPTLTLDEPSNATGYRCFRVQLQLGDTRNGFAKGCTFRDVDFCTGWSQPSKVIDCATCGSGDESGECEQTDDNSSTRVQASSCSFIFAFTVFFVCALMQSTLRIDGY